MAQPDPAPQPTPIGRPRYLLGLALFVGYNLVFCAGLALRALFVPGMRRLLRFQLGYFSRTLGQVLRRERIELGSRARRK